MGTGVWHSRAGRGVWHTAGHKLCVKGATVVSSRKTSGTKASRVFCLFVSKEKTIIWVFV